MSAHPAYLADRRVSGWEPLTPVVLAAAALLAVVLSVPLLLSPGAARLSLGPAGTVPPVLVAGSPTSDRDVAAGSPTPGATGPAGAGPRPSDAVAAREAAAALTGARGLLQRRTAAVATQDGGLWSSAGTDPDAASREFAALASLPVTRFEVRLAEGTLERARNGTDGGSGGGTWRGRALTTYRLGESLTVRREDTFDLVPAGAGWRLGSWTPYPSDGAVAPWQLGPAATAVGPRAVVLAWPTADEVADGGTDLVRAAGRAEQALAWVEAGSGVVDGVLGTAWPRTTLVMVPGTGEQYGGLVPGEQPPVDDVYAAVTADTATVGRTGDVVVLNPGARGELDEGTWEVTVTHELVHVASGALHGDGQPLWLSEGLADLVGWSGLITRPADRDRVAGRMLDRVLAGQGPAALADREQFTSDDAEVVGDAYDGSWLAVLLLEERLGREGLLSLYAATSSGDGTPEERFDAALRRQAGVGTADFEQQWLAYLAQLAADSPNR